MRWPGQAPPEDDVAPARERNVTPAVVAPSLAVAARNVTAVTVPPPSVPESIVASRVTVDRDGATGVTVDARDAVTVERRDATPEPRRHAVTMRPPGDDALEDDDAPSRSRVKVRGWVGRGPVGATVIKAPPWLKAKVAARKGGRVPMWARTNATWFRYGTKAYAWSDRLPPRFAFWPRLLQFLAELVGGVAVVAVAYAWYLYPDLVSWAASVLAGLVCAAFGWTLATAVLLYPHRRRWVKPTAQVLAPVLGYPERTPDRRWLHVPEGFALAGGQIEVALPPTMATDGEDDLSKEILGKLRRKLCLREVKVTWQDDGRNHTLIVRHRTPTKPVPTWARFSEPHYREVVEDLGDSELAIGLTSGFRPVTFDLDTENPHVFLAFGSGGGKSETLKNFGAQLMNRGARCKIFDFKFTSHNWAHGIADIYRSVAEMHCGLVALGKECERRNQEAFEALKAGRPRPNPERLAVLIDEAPTAVSLLNLWWSVERRQLTADDVAAYGDPVWKKSPAVMAMFMALTMGRERNINVFLVSQVANANEIGGSAIRGMLGLRVLGRQPMSAWRMIAPEVDHPPVCSRHRGRIYPVMEGEVFETQGGYFTDDEARAYALAGQDRSRGRVVASNAVTRAAPRDLATGDTGTPVIDVTERLVTIKQASSDEGEGIVPYTHQTLRKWQAEGNGFPEPAEVAKRRGAPNRYRPEDLSSFHEERVAAKGRAS